MTALLQAKIQHGFAAIVDQGPIGDGTSSRLQETAIFGAYTGCFRTMAVVTAVIIPGIFLFRVLRRNPASPTSYEFPGPPREPAGAGAGPKEMLTPAVPAPLAKQPGQSFPRLHG
jgi:hypothetical protein